MSHDGCVAPAVRRWSNVGFEVVVVPRTVMGDLLGIGNPIVERLAHRSVTNAAAKARSMRSSIGPP